MDDLDLIKQKLNIVDLIQEYLPLKKAGINFKANCPFHQEKTPSFVVSPERGIWHCFGCGKGGDHFRFLMEKEGLSFPEAVEILAKKTGVTLKRRRDESRDSRERLYEANQKAGQFFNHILTTHPLGKKALEYLYGRGVTRETIKEFNLGYAPNSWESLTRFLKSRHFSVEEMIASGLVVPSKMGGYDRFRGRIMFPLINVKNETVGFSGRILGEGEPKYVNTPVTPVFDKSSFLFNLNLAKGDIRQKNSVILVEGMMDVVMSYQSGTKDVVATQGTALTASHVELLKRYTDTLILCFDKDLAGDAASRRGIELADGAGMNIRVIRIKEGKDPADVALKNPAEWLKAVEDAELIYDYYLRSVAMRFNPKDAEGKKRIAAELLPIWGKISDTFTREHYIQKLSALLGVDEQLLRREISKDKSSSVASLEGVLKHPDEGSVNQRSRRELLEEYLLALLLKIPADLTFVPNFPETIFLSENHRSTYVLLVLYLDAISFRAKSFDINDFTKGLPVDLVPLIDRLYLTEIDDKLQSSKAWVSEVDKVVAELKKALVKASLERLSQEIKNAQSFGKIEQLEILNRRFRDLSVKLKSL